MDATFKAIESVAISGAELLLYSVNAITTGTDAQGEVTVRLAKSGRIVNGQGADTDIVVASAKAYINALNKLLSDQEKLNPQLDGSRWGGFPRVAEAAGKQQYCQHGFGHRQRLTQSLVGCRAHQAFGDIKQGQHGGPLVRVTLAAQDTE